MYLPAVGLSLVLCVVVSAEMGTTFRPGRSTTRGPLGPRKCYYRGQYYAPGQKVPSSKRCQTCQCLYGGVITCRTVQPARCQRNCPPGFSLVKNNSTMCGSCPLVCARTAVGKTDCFWRGKWYKSGSTVASKYRCMRCSCTSGRVKCRRIYCIIRTCPVGTTAVRVPGGCCISRCKPTVPVKSSCSWRGRTYRNGTRVPILSLCKVCKCISGTVKCGPRFSCSIKTCPTGTLPVRSPFSCCIRRCQPIVPDKSSCRWRGRTYRNGSKVPSWSLCKSCKCILGTVTCGPRFSCPIKQCPTRTLPIRSLFTCCIRRCQIIGKNDCVWKNRLYRNGGWVPRLSLCYKCRCNDGKVVCEHRFSCKIKTCPAGTTVIRSRWTCCILQCKSTAASNCKSSPCLNGGTCFSKANGYTCSCPPSFTGKRCEQRIDYCRPNPCQNQGRCYMLRGKYASFRCICRPGYTGKTCENKITHNNGTKPFLKFTISKKTVLPNDVFTLGCEVANVPRTFIQFVKKVGGSVKVMSVNKHGNGVFEPWFTSGRYSITYKILASERNHIQFTLSVNKAKLEDAGELGCRVTATYGLQQFKTLDVLVAPSSVQLFIYPRPKSIVYRADTENEIHVGKGSKISVKCVSKGSAPAAHMSFTIGSRSYTGKVTAVPVPVPVEGNEAVTYVTTLTKDVMVQSTLNGKAIQCKASTLGLINSQKRSTSVTMKIYG